ncbi:protein kinase domain-containing protein [Williamsia sp.]|uniref:protein kinase domain-containing protein n=1 Tax=Williamsia sp. TaxID=1872085 RepID=UPI002F93C5CD
MAENDPQTTQRDVVHDIAGELVSAGFEDPDLIGQGGFGAVYRCSQPGLDRVVAVKVLADHLDDGNLVRFVREQRAMGRLSGHPNIVNILEVGSTPGGHPFIVMQYHPHDSLDARIRKQGALDWQDVLRVGVKVAGALETAHRTGTLHRDVKPGNILLTEYGEPQLTDFGIARIVGGFETGADIVTGSPAFTAPELLTGADPSVASDIYGLGATLFCALTGHAAFERHSGEQVVAHFLRIAAEPLPDLLETGIPGPVARVIEWAMAREPGDRPASAAEYGESLRDAQRELGVGVDEMALPAARSDDPIAAGPERRVRSGITTSPPTPSTKFRPPLRPRAQVPRLRLMEILRAGKWRRLVLIHAPVGYGKTTVATQWAEELYNTGVPVAWLTVDDDDNDPARFLANLVESLRRAEPVIVGDLAEVIEQHGAEAEQYVLTSLINEIHARGERISVIVDDWHRVTDARSIGALGFLLEHSCHHLQVIITSRTRSGLPISRMRVSDELVELDIAGLCFNADEARSFLLDVSGLDLRNDEVTQLWSSTDGWAAALQLATLSLRGSKSPSDLISHISGRHHAIGDFLAENVLSTLEPAMVNFLLAVSVPDRICAGLATALSLQPNGQALLEDVETRDLFLRRLDQDGDWFRFHPMFGEFLRRRLERDQPDSVTSLHRKASDWFADHAMVAEAVEHSLAAGDTERAVELVEVDGRTLIEQSNVPTLLTMVNKLPRAAVAASPRIQLWLGWANMLLNRAELADAALAAVDRALAHMPDSDHSATEMRWEAAIIAACNGAGNDRMESHDDLIADPVSEPADLPPFVASALANVRTTRATSRFDFDEAHRWQQWAIPYHQQNSGPLAVMYGLALDGIAYFEQLELVEAERRFRSAFQVASGSAMATPSNGARIASALLAQVRYERGDASEAGALLDATFNLDAEEGAVDMIMARYGTGAKVRLIRGEKDAAVDLLDRAADIAERLEAPRLRAFVEAEQMTLNLPSRRGIRARVDHAHRARSPVGFSALVAQLEEEVAIRLLLNEFGDGEATSDSVLACRWAQEWVDRIDGSHRARAALRAERLLATCLSAAGRTDEATRQAAAVLVRCARAGMVRYPLDGGATFRAVVQQIHSDLAEGAAVDAPGVPRSFLDEVITQQGGF